MSLLLVVALSLSAPAPLPRSTPMPPEMVACMTPADYVGAWTMDWRGGKWDYTFNKDGTSHGRAKDAQPGHEYIGTWTIDNEGCLVVHEQQWAPHGPGTRWHYRSVWVKDGGKVNRLKPNGTAYHCTDWSEAATISLKRVK